MFESTFPFLIVFSCKITLFSFGCGYNNIGYLLRMRDKNNVAILNLCNFGLGTLVHRALRFRIEAFVFRCNNPIAWLRFPGGCLQRGIKAFRDDRYLGCAHKINLCLA